MSACTWLSRLCRRMPPVAGIVISRESQGVRIPASDPRLDVDLGDDSLQRLLDIHHQAAAESGGIFNNILRPASSFEQIQFEAVNYLPALVAEIRRLRGGGAT